MQEIELRVVRIPVRADALEAARPIVQRVRHRRNAYIVVAHQLTIEEHPRVRMPLSGPAAANCCRLHALLPAYCSGKNDGSRILMASRAENCRRMERLR